MEYLWLFLKIDGAEQEIIRLTAMYFLFCTSYMIGRTYTSHVFVRTYASQMLIRTYRPIAESLREFENMRKGKYGASEATLRMKMDMTSPNPNMWDQVRCSKSHDNQTI